MSLIEKTAYLNVCGNCGGHAHYVRADGTRSPEFASRAAGREVLAREVEAGFVSKLEAGVLLEQLGSSSLDEVMSGLATLLLGAQILLQLETSGGALDQEATYHSAMPGMSSWLADHTKPREA